MRHHLRIVLLRRPTWTFQFTTRVNERTNERSVSQRVVGLGGVMSPRVVFSSPLHHVSERTVSQRVVCLGGVNSESSCSLQFTTSGPSYLRLQLVRKVALEPG
ncbi:unnamed protein product [Boreogadus saida]